METTTKIFMIGQAVTWVAGQRNCEGIVRDDFGKDIVEVTCTSIDGRRACQKSNVIRELLTIKNKEMSDVKKILAKTKLKKQSKNQLLTKMGKNNVNDLEREVITEILISRGCKLEEIPGCEGKEEAKAPEVKKLKVVKKEEEVPPMIDVDEEPKLSGKQPEKLAKKGEDEMVETSKRMNDINTVSKEEEKVEEKKEEVKKITIRESKSITLEESKEVKGLKTGDKVEFKPSPRLKIEGNITGEVVKIYQCHKADFKEYCQIKGENGKIFYKRSNGITLK